MYEQLKDQAKRKLVDLILIFERMSADRAAEATLLKSGDLSTTGDKMRKHYYFAQMAVCDGCAKLMETARSMLDA